MSVGTESGHSVTVTHREWGDPYLDIRVDLEGEPEGFIGLLGGAHPDNTEGWVTRDGVDLGLNIADRTVRYEEFGHGWRITDEESLFDYADGESTATFTDLDFESFPVRGSAELDPSDPDVAQAEAVCRAAGVEVEPNLTHCIQDFWATGNIDVIDSAVVAEQIGQIPSGEVDPEQFGPWSATDATQELGDEPVEVSWFETADGLITEYGLEDGDLVDVSCAPAGDNEHHRTSTFGTDVYWSNSRLCTSAVHAGQATEADGGIFTIEILERVEHYETEVEDRHGIEARQWGRAGAGFQFVD